MTTLLRFLKISAQLFASFSLCCLSIPAVAQRQGESLPPQAKKPSLCASAVRQAGILSPGTAIDRELAGGQCDIFQIEVKVGEFLHVVAEQKGIDVVLTLLDPQGGVIVAADSANGAWGPESASLIAQTSGTYQVQIKSSEGDAAAGRYQVKITDLRNPTAKDETRIEAENRFDRAGQLWAQGDTEARKKAIALFEGVLPLWRELGDRYAEALTILSVGEIYDDMEENNKALEYYDLALPIERTIGDRTGEADTLGRIASDYDDLDEKKKAIEYYELALPIERAHGDRATEADTLGRIASDYDDLDEKKKAIESYELALPIERAIGDHAGEAETLGLVAGDYDDLDEKKKAIESYELALPIERAIGDHAGEAETLGLIAGDYEDLDENRKALDYYNQALLLDRTLGNRAGEASILDSLGDYYDSAGNEQKALDYYAQALPLERALGDHSDEAATLDKIGGGNDELGEPRKAVDYYGQAVPLEHTLGNRAGEAATLTKIGGDYAELDEKQKAFDSYVQALAISRGIDTPLTEGDAFIGLMNYSKSVGNPALAILFGKQAVNSYQQVNSLKLEKQSHEEFAEQNAVAHRRLADLLIAAGRAEEAGDVLDRSKQEGRPTHGTSPRASEVPLNSYESKLQTEYQQVSDQLSASAQEWAKLSSKPERERTPDEQQQLIAASNKIALANRAFKAYFDHLFANVTHSNP